MQHGEKWAHRHFPLGQGAIEALRSARQLGLLLHLASMEAASISAWRLDGGRGGLAVLWLARQPRTSMEKL